MPKREPCPFGSRGIGDPDPVDLLLDATRLQGILYSESRLRAPWGIRQEPRSEVAFHHVVEGRAWVRLGDAEPVLLDEGALVILPHGAGHVLCDDPSTPAVPLTESSFRLDDRGRRIIETGGMGPSTRLMCGAWRHERTMLHPLLAYLPERISLNRSQVAGRASLRLTLQLLVQEYQEGDVGAASVMGRLLDILFVQALRGWLDEHEETPGWVGALRDPVVGRALRHLHANPAHDWSLDGLARAAGTSRSVLARRFQAAVGEAPMSYLAGVRMQEASLLLQDPSATLPDVATQVGYTSEFAFNRAFKRWAGVPPGRYRTDREPGASSGAHAGTT